MNEVTVRRTVLLDTVLKNRENHRKVFEDGVEVYRAQVIKELDQMLSDATRGLKIRRAISLPEPEDHTRDYDRVIKMLEMSVDDEITLQEHDFERYVMDQWEWNARFEATTAMYAAQNANKRR